MGSGVYMFAEGLTTDELLGPKTESLSQLNMENLRKSPPKLATGALTDLCPRAVDCLNPLSGKAWDTCWIDTVDYHIFSPLGLGDTNGPRYMASSLDRVKADVAKNSDVLTEADFLVMPAARPARYVLNGALEAPA